jgi:glycosyltransferase involved in cell wall biosynthesis
MCVLAILLNQGITGCSIVFRATPLLLQVFPTLDTGGAQARFIALANHFGRSVRHAVVAMDGNYNSVRSLDSDIEVTLPRVQIRKGRSLANRQAFREALKTVRPDLLITHNWGTIEWAMANWPTFVRHIHIEDGFGAEEADCQFFRRVLTRRLFLSRSTLVVPSQNLVSIARRIWRFPEKRVRFIPNGIDCPLYAGPPDAALVRAWAGRGPVIGTVAGLRAEKNVARLLRAFASVARDTSGQIVIVGDGRERPALQALSAELGIGSRVLFTGHVADPSRLYGAFDIFALTSDTEQMPFTILEAMAAARAIVATNVGDIYRMVAPENRPYIVQRSDGAVSAALRALLGDPILRRAIGRANRDTAEVAHQRDSMFEDFAELFSVHSKLQAVVNDQGEAIRREPQGAFAA